MTAAEVRPRPVEAEDIDPGDPWTREVERGQAAPVDAEQVEIETLRQDGAVDADRTKEPLYAVITGLAEQDRAPIMPAWLRNRRERVRVPVVTLGFALYVLAFHAVRLPKYVILGVLMRLAGPGASAAGWCPGCG